MRLGIGLSLSGQSRVPFGPELSAYVAGFASTSGIGAVQVTLSATDGVLGAVSTSTDTADRAEIPISGLEIGVNYRLVLMVRRGAVNANQVIKSSTAFSVSPVFITGETFVTVTQTVVATATSGVVRVYAGDAVGVGGGEVFISSMSVRKVL